MVEDLCSFLYPSANIDLTCNSILRKLRSKNPIFHPDEKKNNEVTPRDQSIVESRADQIAPSNIAHENMLRILPYK